MHQRMICFGFSFSVFIKGWGLICPNDKTMSFSVRLDVDEKTKLFYYSTYFCYYSWAPLYFLVLFIGPTILFQLTFTFIYSIFSNKFSILAK